MFEGKLLISGFEQGRPEVWRQMCDKCKVELLRYALALVGSSYTAEDIVHDGFVHFAQSVDHVGLAGTLKGYPITSVLNRVRNHLRDGNRRGEPPGTRQTSGSLRTCSRLGRKPNRIQRSHGVDGE